MLGWHDIWPVPGAPVLGWHDIWPAPGAHMLTLFQRKKQFISLSNCGDGWYGESCANKGFCSSFTSLSWNYRFLGQIFHVASGGRFKQFFYLSLSTNRRRQFVARAYMWVTRAETFFGALFTNRVSAATLTSLAFSEITYVINRVIMPLAVPN